MKKTIAAVAAVLAMVAAAFAGRIAVPEIVLTSTATAATGTVDVVTGYLEAIRIGPLDAAGVTGSVAVVLVPDATTFAAEALTSNNVITSVSVKPGVLMVDAANVGSTTNCGRRIVWDGKYRVILDTAGVAGKKFRVEFVTETDVP